LFGYKVFVCSLCLLPFCYSLTCSFSQYYSACAIGRQHDGQLPSWLPAFVKLISLSLHVLLAVREINIQLLLVQFSANCLAEINNNKLGY